MAAWVARMILLSMMILMINTWFIAQSITCFITWSSQSHLLIVHSIFPVDDSKKLSRVNENGIIVKIRLPFEVLLVLTLNLCAHARGSFTNVVFHLSGFTFSCLLCVVDIYKYFYHSSIVLTLKHDLPCRIVRL